MSSDNAAVNETEGLARAEGFTPGPWQVLAWSDEKKGFIAIVDKSMTQKHICDVFPFGKRAEGQSLAEHNANARLIAAAPNLAAELSQLELEFQSFIDCGTRPTDEWLRDNCESIRAALAKALTP